MQGATSREAVHGMRNVDFAILRPCRVRFSSLALIDRE